PRGAAEFEAGELGGAGRLDCVGEGVAVVLRRSGSGKQQETDYRTADSTGAPTYHGKRPRVSHKLPLLSAFLCADPRLTAGARCAERVPWPRAGRFPLSLLPRLTPRRRYRNTIGPKCQASKLGALGRMLTR